MMWTRCRSAWLVSGAVFASYVGLAVLFHWPLALHLGTALTGQPSRDTGSYVWNQWVFRHEIVANRAFPLFTTEILSLTPPVDLSLHNYTLFADLLAFPLIPSLGVVTAFNIVFLAISALTAWTMFLLCRQVVGRTGEAWLGGALFGFSPILVARSTEHFSLASAAPLPAFLVCLIRMERKPTAWNAAVVGATIAWATLCDVYFGIYCLLMGALYVGARWWRLRSSPRDPRASRVTEYSITALIIANAAVLIVIAFTGGTEWQVRTRTIGLRSLYTPMLTLTVLTAMRWFVRYRPRVRWHGPPNVRPFVRAVAIAGGVSTALLSPVFYALRARLADEGVLHHPLFWRSSPAGIDLLGLLTPNPNHALFGAPWRAWLSTLSGGYVENVAALTCVGLVVVIVAVWRFGFRPPPEWTLLFLGFAALSLGPFIHVAGINTYIPGPWALLRYVPIVTATRMPGRFAIVAMQAFSVLFVLALAHVRERFPSARRAVFVAVLAALLFELAPLPRTLYSARMPSVYERIGADTRDVTVLELPFGFSDGERGEGAFGTEAQFYQVFHQKAILSGALSRISDNELKRQHAIPIVAALLRLSDGRAVPTSLAQEVRCSASAFLGSSRLGYVVVNTSRTPDALREFAMNTFGLVKIADGDGLELFEPTLNPGSVPDPICESSVTDRPRFKSLANVGLAR